MGVVDGRGLGRRARTKASDKFLPCLKHTSGLFTPGGGARAWVSAPLGIRSEWVVMKEGRLSPQAVGLPRTALDRSEY